MWMDRLSGELASELPEIIEPGRYLTLDRSSAHNSGGADSDALLVDCGSETLSLEDKRLFFALPPKAIAQKVELFGRILETINGSIDESAELASPLMPEGVVNEDSGLNTFELKLLETIDAGHLHQISLRPRLDLHYEDEVTDVARAKRLAKGALVHLASHSECWQRQTLTGVIPKRVKARFSEDDFGIYENQVYARLLDKIEQYLNWRVNTLRQLESTVSEALAFYESSELHHRLTQEICRLWGKSFTQESTSKATEQLKETLNQLERALGIIRGLKQSGLYLLVGRSAQIGSGLHLTNILSHDQHYRHLPVLWNALKGIAGGKQATPEERQQHNQALNAAYSRYAGLVLRHALQPYLGSSLKTAWAEMQLELRSVGLDWQLLLTSADDSVAERVLLEVVPWMGFVARPEGIASREVEQDGRCRILAWPNLDADRLHTDEAFSDGSWLQLSPFDLYGVERFGYLVDQLLQRELVAGYGEPLTKIPTQTLAEAGQVAGLGVNHQSHEFAVLEALSPESLPMLEQSLVGANATAQARQLRRRQQALLALQKCPVCSQSVKVTHQRPDGFIADCLSCKTKRYLRSQQGRREFEQILAGQSEFRLVGRRSFVCQL